MGSKGTEQPAMGEIVRTIILASLVIILPVSQWSLFGWLHMFLPLLALYTLSRFGDYTGKRLLVIAGLISLFVYLVLGEIELFAFSLALLLSGYVLFHSAERHDPPALSGLKSVATLVAGWIVILTMLSLGSETSPYGQLIQTLDAGIGEAVKYYRQNSEISADTLAMLEATLYRMKVIIPLILPSILGGFILAITWFTMVMGNLLVLKTNGSALWESYRYWILPEKVIWLAIGSGILALLPSNLIRAIGINSLILLSIVYCFQGLSIIVFFMNKWNVPLLLRSFFYVMIVLQSLGTVILLIFGVADIWFDFRKLKQETVHRPK